MIQIRKPSLKNKKGVELRNFFDNVSEACFVRISCRDVDNFCFDTIPFKKKDFLIYSSSHLESTRKNFVFI